MRILILLVAVSVGALGFVVMYGWILRLPALLQVLPGSSSMVLATAFAFLLSGATLGMIGEGRAQGIARGLAIMVAALAAGVLVQHAFGLDLALDLPRLQDWIADGNPHPGRMSAFTASAFLAFGAGALALTLREGRTTLLMATAAAWFMVAVAALNLLGYVLRLEDLFAFMQVNRMAPHTSVGALALGAGLLLAVNVRMRRAAVSLPVEKRITATSFALLVLAAVVAGGAVFALMQQNLQHTASAMLGNMLATRQQLLLAQVAQRQAEIELVLAQPQLHRAIRAGDTASLATAMHGFIGSEFSGLAVLDAQGRELARVGVFLESPERSARIHGIADAEIRSLGQNVYLRSQTPVQAGGGVLGSLVSEQPLELLSRMMAGEEAYGETGETALCHTGGERIWCFPQRLRPRAFDVPRTASGHARLPMDYALDGMTGVVRTRDYRGKNVLAAYGPVGSPGLGMVVKVDTAELFASVRAQLWNLLLAALATVVLGAWLLRRSVHPLAARMAAAESAAHDARDQLQQIADNVPALVGYVDAQRRYRFANRAYLDWFGFDHRTMAGRTVEDVVGAANYARIQSHVSRALAGERVDFVDHFPGPDRSRTVHTSYVPDPGPGGGTQGYFILSSDITAAETASKSLDRALQRLDLALDASRVTVWESDLRKDEVVLSDAWAELLDRPRGETRTTVAELASLVHPDDLQEVMRLSMETVKGKRDHYAVEHRVRASSGHWKWILSRGQVTERDPATGKPLRMMGTNLDITERKRAEIEMERMANYDGLTGAVNRNLFRDRLRRAIAQCRRTKAGAALMYLDIDKFKGINDSLGHAAGDALLREFAARLKAAGRDTDTVGRLGGDEFAVLMEDVKDAEAPGRVAQKILEAMREPVDADGTAVTVTTSIGVALFDGGADPEALARRADEALYAAKAAGRNTYRVGS